MHGGVPMHKGNFYLKKRKTALLIILLAVIALFILVCLNKTAKEIALLNAEDILKQKINKCISDIMYSEHYRSADFIRIEKNSSGELTAIISDMTLINELSSEILLKLKDCGFKLMLPLGNLSGLKALMGKGPRIPLELRVLASSGLESENTALKAEERNCFRVYLKLKADTLVILPWCREKGQFNTNIIIAEAVVFPKNPVS